MRQERINELLEIAQGWGRKPWRYRPEKKSLRERHEQLRQRMKLAQRCPYKPLNPKRAAAPAICA